MATRPRPRSEPAPTSPQTPFLKPEDVQPGDIFALTGFVRHLDGRFGEQIAIEVTQNRTGKDFDFAFKVGGNVHRKLFKRFGADEKKWRGTITLAPEEGRGMRWIAIKDVDSDEPPFMEDEPPARTDE